MVARVTTGGYQDVMHMRVTTSFVRRPGSNYRPRRVLQARIYHKSLDSKPSSWSGYTYTKIANR